MISKEAILHQQVVNYLKIQYPRVLFRTDFAAGIRMTLGQAAKHKRLQAIKGWPDLFIAEPRGVYAGCFIELKASNIYKKDGTLLKNKHLETQLTALSKLNYRGYYSVFAVGFEEAREVIDKYMSNPPPAVKMEALLR